MALGAAIRVRREVRVIKVRGTERYRVQQKDENYWTNRSEWNTIGYEPRWEAGVTNKANLRAGERYLDGNPRIVELSR